MKSAATEKTVSLMLDRLKYQTKKTKAEYFRIDRREAEALLAYMKESKV